MKGFAKLNSQGRIFNLKNDLPRIFFLLANLGLAVFIALISARILMSGADSVRPEQGDPWPFSIKVLSFVNIVVSAALIFSQGMVFFRNKKSARLLVLCLFFFVAEYFVELLSVFRLHGLMLFQYDVAAYFLVLSSWAILNYCYWCRVWRG